jgi:alpha-tubulin suppressor-like RCC1 family protein
LRVVCYALFVAGSLSAGCTLIANLGDPKELDPGDAGEDRVTSEASVGDGAGEGDDALDAGDAGDVIDAGDGDAATGTLQAAAIAVGGTHACAVVQVGPGSPLNGTIRCWGSNGSGELGQDPATVGASARPVEVVGRGLPRQTGASTLALAPGYSCTVTVDGYLLCWGGVPSADGVSPLDPLPAYEPTEMNIGAAPIHSVATASMSGPGGCVASLDRLLVCWGGPFASDIPDAGITTLDGGALLADEFDMVAVGRAHVCGILATASSSTHDVECWGANDHGQVGLPSSTTVSAPHRLGLGQLGTLKQVAAGGDNSCALFEGGALYCWGAADRGQLGSTDAGNASEVPTPITFPTQATPTAVALGDAHACALLSDHSVWCWGDDTKSQLGAGDAGPAWTATPQPVMRPSGNSLKEVQSIGAGGGTTCAISLQLNQVVCWGANDQGQAGQIPGAPVTLATAVNW